MSFYSHPQNIQPGPVDGNAASGLAHRVAISSTRVLDSCCKQINSNSVTLVLSSLSHPIPVPPFTFVNAVSTGNQGVITDLSISRLEERKCFARVKCNVTTPLRVTFSDSTNVKCTAESEITQALDVILYIPPASVFPFEIIAATSCSCPNGKVTDAETVVVTACQTILLKVTAATDLLIPTYGFCPSPLAVDFEREACGDFFELPLYPSGHRA